MRPRNPPSGVEGDGSQKSADCLIFPKNLQKIPKNQKKSELRLKTGLESGPRFAIWPPWRGHGEVQNSSRRGLGRLQKRSISPGKKKLQVLAWQKIIDFCVCPFGVAPKCHPSSTRAVFLAPQVSASEGPFGAQKVEHSMRIRVSQKRNCTLCAPLELEKCHESGPKWTLFDDNRSIIHGR